VAAPLSSGWLTVCSVQPMPLNSTRTHRLG